MTIYLHNLLNLRAEKQSVTMNQSDCPVQQAVETLTILDRVPVTTVRDCCSLFAYYLRLQYGFNYVDFEPEQLTREERENFDTISAIQSFGQYAQMCKHMIEGVLASGREVYARLEKRTMSQRNDSKLRGGEGLYEENSSKDTETDTETEDMINIRSLLSSMDIMFNQFYEMFLNNDCFPETSMFEKMFISRCLSHREKLNMRRSHLSNLNILLNTLTQAVILSTDHCNSMFEAFFGTGMLFTVLLNVITSEYRTIDLHVNEIVSTPTANATMPYWTRVRLQNEEDRPSIHLLKNTTTPAYMAAIKRLPSELFNVESGLDVYLSVGDTLCTMFIQFIGRISQRLIEWIERNDVKTYVNKHYVYGDAYSLIKSIGRGDQGAWIRFFRRTQDRSSRLYIKLDILIQLNDELACAFGEKQTNTVPGSGGGGKVLETVARKRAMLDGIQSATDKDQLSKTAVQQLKMAPDVANKYKAFTDFMNRYNDFVETSAKDKLFDHWTNLRNEFLLNSGSSLRPDDFNDTNMLTKLDQVNSPLTSYKQWCKDINTTLFPYNILLLAVNFNKDKPIEVNLPTFSEENLQLAWVYKCQEYLRNRRFTSSKCTQIYKYLTNLEVKSRMFYEENTFMFLFSQAISEMPFMYELFGEIAEEHNHNEKEDEQPPKSKNEAEPMDTS